VVRPSPPHFIIGPLAHRSRSANTSRRSSWSRSRRTFMACTECRRRQVKVGFVPAINDTKHSADFADRGLSHPTVHPFRVRWPGLRTMRKAQDQMRIHVHSGTETPFNPR
jgi:hypothetical protein